MASETGHVLQTTPHLYKYMLFYANQVHILCYNAKMGVVIVPVIIMHVYVYNVWLNGAFIVLFWLLHFKVMPNIRFEPSTLGFRVHLVPSEPSVLSSGQGSCLLYRSFLSGGHKAILSCCRIWTNDLRTPSPAFPLGGSRPVLRQVTPMHLSFRFWLLRFKIDSLHVMRFVPSMFRFSVLSQPFGVSKIIHTTTFLVQHKQSF